MNPSKGGWVILLTIFAAMVLAVVHMPETWPQWLGWFRPNWLILVVFFWVIELPHRVGLISTWLVGLCVDALVGAPLGFNAFILAGVTYVAWRFFERLRMYSIVQQCGVVFLLVLGAEALAVVAQFANAWTWQWQVVFVPIVSTLLWPFLYLVLIRIRTGVRVE